MASIGAPQSELAQVGTIPGYRREMAAVFLEGGRVFQVKRGRVNVPPPQNSYNCNPGFDSGHKQPIR